jgi:TRAP-type transport system periplasmic protein
MVDRKKTERLIEVRGLIYTIILSLIFFFNINCMRINEKKYTELKLSISMPAMHSITVNGFRAWARNIEQATDGNIKIVIFPGETIAKVDNSYDAVISGACDLAMLVPPYEPNRFPLTMIMNLPLGIKSALNSSKVAWKLFQSFPEIRAEYKEVKVLFFYSTSAYQIHSVKKPIEKIEDLKGMILRVGGIEDKAIAETLGATPEFLPMPDTYLALEKGTLDAQLSPFGPMKGFRTAEVTRFHLQNADLHTSVFAVVMNQDKWMSLPKTHQEAIERVSGSQAAELFGSVFDETDIETIKFMEEKGDVFACLLDEEKDKLERLLLNIRQWWVNKLEAKGLPGQEVLDEALRLVKKCAEGTKLL